MDSTQLIHDRVNLLRLVTRLEDDVRDRNSKWGKEGLQAWVKASTAQQVGDTFSSFGIVES